MSMHNNFSDASNESQQMQLLEGHFQDDVMGGLPSGRGDDQSMIEFQPDFSVMSGASSNHQTLPFQRPTRVPSEINHTSPMEEMVIKYRDELRRHVVTWSFGEEPDYTSAYVDPLTRECFLSGELVNGNVVFSNSLIWYKSANEASDAALARAIDCFEYRERTLRPLGRRVKEDPYENGSGPPFPLSIPMDTWKQIHRLQFHQRKTAAAAAATVVSEMSSLTPEKHRSALPAPAPKARSENDNPKTKLHERYHIGFVNGTKVASFSIPKENFVTWRLGVDHQPMFSAAFVCPLSGEIFLSGELIHFGENESFEKNNLMWYLSKKKSIEAAAATAEDCFQFREEMDNDGVSQQIQFCIAPPYLEGKEPLETSILKDIIPHEYWIKIQKLQEAAAWRKL